jgi:hypothetical protein
MKRPTSSKNSVEVDFTGVESGGGGRGVPDGEYSLKVVSVEQKTSQSGNPMLNFKHKVASGDYQGSTVYDNVSLTPQALWRFRGMLECMGMEIPEGKLKVDLDGMIGKIIKVEIANETYQGKERPKITSFLFGGAEEKVSTKSTPGTGGFRKGDKVTFTDDGNPFEGKILTLDGASAVIDVDGDEWELSLSELTKA